MKKALVFLLILAVAGGIFAQDGTITWSGEFRAGAEVDFTGGDPSIAPVYDHNYGLGRLSYDKGALNTEFAFKGEFNEASDTATTLNGSLSAFLEYGDGVNGETAIPFKVAVKSNLLDTTNGGVLGFGEPATAYAYYYFWERQIKLDVSYRGYETIYWRASDIVASAWDNLDGNAGIVLSYRPQFLSGLSTGFWFPLVVSANTSGTAITKGSFPGSLEDYFSWTVFGIKYDSGKFIISAQYNNAGGWDRQAANLGLKFIVSDALAVRGDFQFENFGDFGDQGIIAGGLNGEFVALPLTAGLTAKITALGTASDAASGLLSINPYVYYNIVADTLQARLPITLDIGIQDNKALNALTVAPALYWNFKQDGVGDDPASGLLFNYTLKYALDAGELDTSTLGVKFRLAF
jgi:hypothetical protein